MIWILALVCVLRVNLVSTHPLEEQDVNLKTRIQRLYQGHLTDRPGTPLSPDDYKLAESLGPAVSAPPVDEGGRDILESAGLFQGDIDGLPPKPSKEEIRSAINDMNQRWPSGIIPYVISHEFDYYERATLAQSFRSYETNTCLRFVPRSSQADYIHIYKGQGCSSLVGRNGGGQPVSLGNGCVYPGIAIHEFMHAAGFWHEQMRPDRDQYVIIHWDNITPGQDFNFQKLEWNQINNLGIKYDTGSVMHYASNAFAQDPSRPTIESRIPGEQLGQRYGFSQVDIQKLKVLYQCRNYVQTPAKPQLPQSGCKDTDENCGKWARDGLCDKNPGMMALSCPRSCSQCDKPSCRDLEDRCGAWALDGQCKSNPDYMLLYCAKSCGGCGRFNPSKPLIPGDASKECVDDLEMCQEWRGKNQCNSNPSFMGRYCRKECQFCNSTRSYFD